MKAPPIMLGVRAGNQEQRRTYARRVRLARARTGWTQKQLAAESTIDRATISWYETGRCAPSLAKLVRLANALGCTTDYLLGRTA